MPHRDPAQARAYFAARYQAKKVELEAQKAARRDVIGEEEHLRRRREYNRRAKYGLSPDAFEVLWEKQRGICAVCPTALNKDAKKGPGTVCVDHNHATGAVRGLLCRGCNVAVGFIEKDPVRTESALAYLEATSAIDTDQPAG